jgi:hypothetical protein
VDSPPGEMGMPTPPVGEYYANKNVEFATTRRMVG